MNCPREVDVAVYVLGALDPPERADLETHLAGCGHCRAALAAAAGLPGLLARVPEPAPGGPPPVPLPPAVLDGVLHRLRRRRRVRTLIAAAAVVVAVLGGVMLSPLVLPDGGEAAAREVALPATGGSSSSGLAGLVPQPWGTQVSLRCRSYPSPPGAPAPPADPAAPRTVYVLLVRTATGGEEQIARWSPPPGQDVTVDAATDLHLDQVAGLEVRTTDGRTVMRS